MRPKCILLVVAALAGLGVGLSSASESLDLKPFVGAPVEPRSVSVDLRTLPKVDPGAEGLIRHVARRRPDVPLPPRIREPIDDPVRQVSRSGSAAPDPLLTFDGISATGALPPDTVGDVGPNHYVQMVNSVFAVFDKSGVLVAGPSPISAIFDAAGMGAPCGTTNRGDPIVLYDSQADRWLLSQFASPKNQCIAISQGPNPVTDGFYAYDFSLPQFPDYPKFGVWPDAYYMGANAAAKAFAFDRVSMLAGAPATFVSFSPASIGLHSTLLPSDLDGATPPPPDTPGFFIRHVDGESFGGSDRLEIFEFDVDFATPANSTFSGPTALLTAAFTSLCGFAFDCIEQKDTTAGLDSVTEWPMWRLAYRNFGSHQAMVINHAVNVGSDQAGVRWYELRQSGGGPWSIFQQGTWAPDGLSRWMGSAAMDRLGNVAIGYSASSASDYPSLRYAARLAGDTPGILTLGESLLYAGSGSQTSTYYRWGDYSSLNVDPLDDCTFWFTGEYYPATSSWQWSTRVGSFVLPGCSCVDDLVLDNTTITGTETLTGGESVTLGENLVIDGTMIEIVAGSRIVFVENVEVGGTFSGGIDAGVSCP